MTIDDRIKVEKAGFIILRAFDDIKPSIRVHNNGAWKTYAKYDTKKLRDQALKYFLKDPKFITD